MDLYKGSTTRIISSGIGGATLFGLNNTFKDIFSVNVDRDGVFTPGFLGAAALTGVAESFLYTPFEAIKLRMQVADRSKNVTLAGSVYKLFMKGGVSSFYRGFGATVGREVSGNIAYFTTYQANIVL